VVPEGEPPSQQFLKEEEDTYIHLEFPIWARD